MLYGVKCVVYGIGTIQYNTDRDYHGDVCDPCPLIAYQDNGEDIDSDGCV